MSATTTPMRFFEVTASGPAFSKAVKKLRELGGQFDGAAKVWGVRSAYPGDIAHMDNAPLYGFREISREEYKARRAAALAQEGK